MPAAHSDPRQLALTALRSIRGRGAFADLALDRVLQTNQLADADRGLLTELVYGISRRERTLDALIDQFARKPAADQPPDLRNLLHLGLYQLRYLNQIPASAAVNTTVDLAKRNGLAGLSGLVNGLLRSYVRAQATGEPLQLSEDPIKRLGALHSFPDWLIQLWLETIGHEETEALCTWLNRPPHFDLRVNRLRASFEQVQTALAAYDAMPVVGVPGALRLRGRVGAVQKLPGFAEGWWTVQDSSAQLVAQLLDPQPGEVIADACAAPGGKTTHLAELMGDQGKIWACDLYANRLKRLTGNCQRLVLSSINLRCGDSRSFDDLQGTCDRVLIDAPCSGLGTLHRHADARWRQTPETIQDLARLQTELLHHTSGWVKPGGSLVYATCTLHPLENEQVVEQFLRQHPQWRILSPERLNLPELVTPEGYIKVWPQRHDMDGFFMAKLVCTAT
ncbi:16S rRNA (cytosine(967)-C(5))-methyltransferase [Leptolyngbya sp. FACHB-261]|uniref:16S rRNA (cytosine(967)-C(5))-methyltransferase n=1 Tax=Leptolyngbya sp. FACHB-261 TaxID=2692806 RepID=UPI001684BED1|nr:16S rRNA (cytosine(967)-C(5))-methyltransferase [Leptolyngbya sp. FACHB-261]MBD2099843.1 16S rRNA (cytosine(967)-C(5))-methyltransferase [Leptolyngbya sp. FACHB-261]